MPTVTFKWTLEPYQQRGNLWLRWNTNAPFRAQQDQIHVFENDFPVHPTGPSKWVWADKGIWDTGLPWGIGWNCAYIAQAPPNDSYVYVIKVTTDVTMGANVKKMVPFSFSISGT